MTKMSNTTISNTTVTPSRRDILAGAAGIAGAAGLGAATFALGEAIAQPAGLPVRRDIAAFAPDDPQIAKFAAAIQEMMDRSARDPNDPKGWLVNANAHATFCAVPSPTDPDQIHYCYWFLSWHRAIGTCHFDCAQPGGTRMGSSGCAMRSSGDLERGSKICRPAERTG